MITTQQAAVLSTESLEVISDRASHALEYTAQLQALCRTIGADSSAPADQRDDSADDMRKIVLGMGLTLNLIQAALDDVQSVLPRVEAQAEEETEQDAVSRNGVEDMNPTAALVEA